jgi:hypothetical protein
VLEELPLRTERDYTASQFIDAVYTVDHADRYRTREAQS